MVLDINIKLRKNISISRCVVIDYRVEINAIKAINSVINLDYSLIVENQY